MTRKSVWKPNHCTLKYVIFIIKKLPNLNDHNFPGTHNVLDNFKKWQAFKLSLVKNDWNNQNFDDKDVHIHLIIGPACSQQSTSSCSSSSTSSCTSSSTAVEVVSSMRLVPKGVEQPIILEETPTFLVQSLSNSQSSLQGQKMKQVPRADLIIHTSVTVHWYRICLVKL